ncbi:MAG: alpha/beta fold hydrolase [Methylococcaceae bacterium]|nr:alpha/beta fold hydrolase [Methylococcaceae bacterium]
MFKLNPLKHLRPFLIYGTAAILTALLTLYILYLQSRRDLEPWHLARLDAEFTAEDAKAVNTLSDYQRLEGRVFSQLREEVYDQVPDEQRRLVNRYADGSLADPTAYPRDWNRSFELDAAPAAGGLLLLHGLSDSPYSMRALGERLNRRGWRVLGLRLPGHGTAPAGLTRATWQDFAATMRLGARHLRQKIGPEAPLFIVGYSNGAALAVEYALARQGGEDLPRVDGLVLLSPAIGVSPAAALAVWQSRLALIPGLEKLAWNSLAPEYDPYKYASFAVNAGDQVYQLTRVIGKRLAALARTGGL